MKTPLQRLIAEAGEESWEYLVLHTNYPPEIGRLATIGAVGWEMCSMVREAYRAGWATYFKRQGMNARARKPKPAEASARTEWLAEMCARIDFCATLEEGWDGEGALPINEATRDLAKKCAATLPPPKTGEWTVAPMFDGGINFEAETEDIQVWANAPAQQRREEPPT